MLYNKHIPNNNQSVIRFLEKNFARTKKIRNTILFFSVVISITAITMVFGIPLGKIKAEEIRLIKEKGTASSGMLIDGSDKQYEKLKQLDYIKQVGKSIFVGEAEGTNESKIESICEIAWVDIDSWRYFMQPAYTNVIGYYPQTEEEILLSERALKKIGISEPKQDMNIELDVSIGLFKNTKETFKLCGWFEDSSGDQPVGYVSKSKVEEWNLPKDHYTLLFRQADSWGHEKTEEKLYQTLQMKSDDQKIKVSDTARYIAVAKLSGGYEMIILGTLGILCGIYFLVRNVLWMSMSEDIQNLGLLNTIGATEKQIAKIYRRQMQWIMFKGSVLGVLFSVFVLTVLIPKILGFYYYQEMGGETLLYFFRPEILFIAVVFVNGILWIASEKIIRKIVNMSCVESVSYDEKIRAKKADYSRKMIRKRTTAGEMLYIAWNNVSRYKERFVITCLSIFLGVLFFMVMNVISEGSDYIHILEKRPDFLLAGEFSEYGKSQGYGEEYKTREIDEDPMLTQGDGMALLYDNAYDEFSPVSECVEEKLQKLKGVDWENSNKIEGAYLNTIISKKGIRPYTEGVATIGEGSVVEGFSWDTIQVLKEQEISLLKKYVHDYQLNIDIKSLEEGNGVLIIHDHMLNPEQQKLAEEAVGEPVYFKTMISKEDAVQRSERSDSDMKEEQQAEAFSQKSSEMFKLCGYLDSQHEQFPKIHQSWHGAEGSLYFLISEKGFQKIPTEKKILAIELNVYSGKELYIKSKIQEIISEENKKRSKMTEVSLDEGVGEAGIFVISKSDLIQQKEIYMRGSRILLGSVSIILLIAGITNYFNVVLTGTYSRRKEFEIMQSIGMTDKQMKWMLYGEGGYYILCVLGMLFTVGTIILLGVKAYMENRLSYFVFHWPILMNVVIIFSFVFINIVITHFVWKIFPESLKL